MAWAAEKRDADDATGSNAGGVAPQNALRRRGNRPDAGTAATAPVAAPRRNSQTRLWSTLPGQPVGFQDGVLKALNRSGAIDFSGSGTLQRLVRHIGHDATIDDEFRTGRVGGLIAGQEQ